ncbi:Transposon Ty3-I Gag-Pol polyprotein [Araneus ventricosus]|uniref:Transposon Ty3-I Gag-Pol polyprotein n=1 Tax=Araneus ventricosus TaxID=182803 RepID=A0A4Y2NNL3_ARAVE|nr:Transposon Ty3-I Gag-Pol polyprotein [Araneus ventricosus]
MNDKTNAKPDESGIVKQATNSVNIIPFDQNNSMNVNSWLKYFNDKCQEYNLDDKWKLNNITSYLKNNALTEYVNSYDTIKTWEEFISFLTERYISPNLVNLSDFTSKSFKKGDDITLYFQEKLKIGRQLNLATSMILEGLSDGLPVNLRQLLAINSPNNPREWLTTASKLIKIQKSDENQINSSHSATQNLKTNSVNVFSKDKYDVGALRVEPQRIVLNSDLPVNLRPYRTSPVKEQEIKSQVEKLLQAGLIKESNSPYSSPVTLAFKRDEGKKTRLCIDFRKLNALCKSDSEPLPLMDSLLDKLSKAKIFSSLDLASGYWHVPIHPKDTEKLAFCTNFGLYEWCRLPFGIKVAPAIFNRLIRRILTKYKIDFACNYFDDIIVYSSSELEHWKHLKRIFEICEKENIKLKLSKCAFAQTKISFLGYEIEQGKVSPNNATIETIKKLQPPTNVKELQRMQDAFEKLKETLTTKPVLNLYNPDVTCHVFVDASQKSVGAVLKQPDASDILHPIAYNSRTLRDYEKNYAITELECLAIVDALDKFYYYLHGQKFVIHTDHAALVWLKNVKNLRAHYPQTNGKVEGVNQSLVTRLKCKVNSTSTKVPWTKLLESVTNEYNLTPHSITKYPPAYLLFGTLPYDSPIGQNSYYEPVNEARNLALQGTIDYHNKNKIRYDARFVDKKFNPGDLVVYEEFCCSCYKNHPTLGQNIY